MNQTSENSNDALSDADLLKRFQAGDKAAAVEIYTRYAHRLLQLTFKQSGAELAQRIDADDIVQSVFRTFFRRATGGYYQLPDGDELWNLFLVISLNKIRKKSNFHHAAKRDVSKTEQLDFQSETLTTPESILQLTIDELIAELPQEHQGVVRDRIQGFEVGEISERNQLSRRTTERILQGFRKRLERELEIE